MSWVPEFIVFLLVSTLVDFVCAKNMSALKAQGSKRTYLAISFIVNLGLLAYFKYGNFFISNTNQIFQLFSSDYTIPHYSIILPIGLSFYTFQTLSYTIDVYKGKIKAEQKFLDFALYVCFFPQLVAGPIERASKLLPQLKKPFSYSYSYTREGLLLILWGLFKKIMIADRLHEYVGIVFNNPTEHKGLTSILGSLFYTIQLYCDFSGYSDIAIGAALMIGIRLSINFKRPFFSKSSAELISKWHMSLMKWFKDYLFIPIGGSKVSTWKVIRNLIVVWSLTGLWHGANWTFVLTALLNCFFIFSGFLTYRFRNSLIKKITNQAVLKVIGVLEVFYTIIISATAMVFFRSNTVSDGLLIIKSFFFIDLSQRVNLYLNRYEFWLALFAITLLFTVEYLQEKHGCWELFYYKLSRLHRYSFVLFMVVLILFFGKSEKIEFIYFQF